MPHKPKRPCRYPGCSRLTDGIYCEEHKKLMEQHYEHFTRGYKTTSGMDHNGGRSDRDMLRSILYARIASKRGDT